MSDYEYYECECGRQHPVGVTCAIGKRSRSFDAPPGSVAWSDDLMPYEEWIALGPDKAAEYLAQKRGYDGERQRKLRLILEAYQEDKPPNEGAKPQPR